MKMLQMAKRLSAKGAAVRVAVTLAIAAVLACLACGTPLATGLTTGQAFAADLTAGSIDTLKANGAQLSPQAGVTLNADYVDLYGVDPDVVEKSGPIPASKPTQFQIKVTGGSVLRYRVTDGNTVDVSSTGLITPRYTTRYWKDGVGTTAKPDDMTGVKVDVSFNSGESTVTVYTDNGSASVKVNVIDYGYEFFDQALDAYLAENVTEGMTVREKVEVAARYAASFPYKYNASSAYGMFYNEGGDCWASTGMIIKLCKKMGLDAWTRNANIDAGAGSGHRNAIIDAGDGTYLIAEAGYSYETAPRPYDVYETTSLWNYSVTSSENKEIELIQYDGKTWPEHFEIPQTVDGYTVTSLGETSLYCGSFKSVSIPDTVTSIGPFAFSGCSNLESLEIGSQVTTVGDSAFVQCDNLKLTVADGNPNYSVEGDVLYNKDKTTLISAQNVSSIAIPDTVTEIGKGAFYCNYTIKEVTIPASVRHIGDYAFVSTGIKKYNFQPKVAPTLEENSLVSLSSYCDLRIPLRSSGYDVEPWTNANVIQSTLADADVTLSEASYAYDGTAKTPHVLSVKVDGEELVEGADYALDGYKDNVDAGKGKVLLSGIGDVKGSKAAEFTIQPLDLSIASFAMGKTLFMYNGKPARLAITDVEIGSTKLVEGSDYRLDYRNNVNAGAAEVSIVGIGNYCGKITRPFSIAKAPNTLSAKAKAKKLKVKAGKSLKAEKAFSVSKARGRVTYSKIFGNAKIKVASNGKISVKRGIKKKTYKVTVTVTAAGNTNYLPATKTVTLKLKVR